MKRYRFGSGNNIDADTVATTYLYKNTSFKINTHRRLMNNERRRLVPRVVRVVAGGADARRRRHRIGVGRAVVLALDVCYCELGGF